ncbi:Uncharacterised protein [Mycobacteroides abscessus subsp. abscessus]|nr:Uncharacterised protein [Mycobacteroides abscessus subsp. abscessus]
MLAQHRIHGHMDGTQFEDREHRDVELRTVAQVQANAVADANPLSA